jgi:hypothetical protein
VLSLSLPALADLDYALKPRQIAEDTWLLEGSTDNFAKANGGNIVNTAFIVTDAGVVVIDTGPSKRYGEAMRQAIAPSPTTGDRGAADPPSPDHVLGNQAFTDVPIGALAGTTRTAAQQGDAMAKTCTAGRRLDARHRGGAADPGAAAGVQRFGNHDLQLLALAGIPVPTWRFSTRKPACCLPAIWCSISGR